MPKGVNVTLDGGYARLSFPDPEKVGPALHALLQTGAPIEVRTGGVRREYIVPEGNAREAGLLDEPIQKTAPTAFVPAEPVAVDEPVVVKTAPKKTAKKATSAPKETTDGKS